MWMSEGGKRADCSGSSGDWRKERINEVRSGEVWICEVNEGVTEVREGGCLSPVAQCSVLSCLVLSAQCSVLAGAL